MPRRPVKKSKKLSRKRKLGFSWKKIFTTKKARKKIQKLFAGFFLLVISVGFLGGLWIYKILTTPFASAESDTSVDLTKNEFVTFAAIVVEDLGGDPLQTKSIHYFIIDKLKKKVVAFEIPLTEKVNIPGKFGQELYSKVPSIGFMSAKDDVLESAANLVRDCLKSDFRYKVDRYLLMDESAKPILDIFTRGGGVDLSLLGDFSELVTSVKTDFLAAEFYDVYKFVKSLPDDRFFVYNTSPANYESTSDIIQDITFDSAVALEEKSIAILNGSGISGAAKYSSEVVENMGGRIILVENARNLYKNSVLIADDLESQTARELVRFFGIKEVYYKNSGMVEEDIVDRSDVTIIVGFDMQDSL